jgi:hypothetical protein
LLARRTMTSKLDFFAPVDTQPAP